MSTQTVANGAGGRTHPGKFVWFEHVSGDARTAQAFYGEVLGWKAEAWGDSGYEMILAGETLDTMIGGYAAAGDGQPAHWISYVSVEDVDAAAEAADGNGGRVIEPPRDLPGVGRAARIADPLGAELCVFRNDSGDPPDAPFTEPPPLRHFFWNELHTTDAPKALAFYGKVLGFSHRALDMGEGGTYYILSRDGVDRGGLTSLIAPGVTPHWLPYVEVADADATIAHARELGGTICLEPIDIPGIGRFGVMADPTGAALAVMKTVPPSAEQG